MAIALDFGTSNSVIARWNEAADDVEVMAAGSLSRRYTYRLPGGDRERVASVVPSLIHYGTDGSKLLGEQVAEGGLVSERGTFRWVKLELLHERKGGRRINGEVIDNYQAARELLRRVLLVAQDYLLSGGEELVLTMPVESFDSYADWLQRTVAELLPCRLRTLDEATACILGYRDRLQPGAVYLVVDFGGGTLDVSVVKPDLDTVVAGERQPALGRAGLELGGSNIDAWMLEHLKATEELTAQDVEEVGTALLAQLEQAKIDLSSGANTADVSQWNDRTRRLISHTFTSAELRDLLERHDVYSQVSRTVNQAIELAEDKYGLRRSEIAGVFCVGGSSLLLGVGQRLHELLPDRPIYCDNPFEAVARGACRFAGQDLSAALVHEYCLRTWNPTAGDYELLPIVARGTVYPTPKAVCAKYLNGAVDGATGIALEIWERSIMPRTSRRLKVVDGVVREEVVRQEATANERPVTPRGREFIIADPPCRLGDQQRFIARFGVDSAKRLTISLSDMAEGGRSKVRLDSGEEIALPVRNLPVVKL